MRRLTDEERIALVEVAVGDDRPVNDATFAECIRMGWGYWEPGTAEGYWCVTASGREALRLDDLARATENA